MILYMYIQCISPGRYSPYLVGNYVIQPFHLFPFFSFYLSWLSENLELIFGLSCTNFQSSLITQHFPSKRGSYFYVLMFKSILYCLYYLFTVNSLKLHIYGLYLFKYKDK